MATGSDFDRNVEYLHDVQYRDSTELAKRANLHVKYRTAPLPAFEWLPRLFTWPDTGKVLDVGCGGGFLWEQAAAAIPTGLDLTLSDLSAGMVAEAVERADSTGRFATVSGHPCDARALPFDDTAVLGLVGEHRFALDPTMLPHLDVTVVELPLRHAVRPGALGDHVERPRNRWTPKGALIDVVTEASAMSTRMAAFECAGLGR